MSPPVEARARRTRRAWRAAFVALSVLAVLSAWFLWRAGELLVISRPLPSPDVIVSLGSHEWERLPLSAALARRSPRSIVVLTLPQTITKYNCDDCPGRVARLGRMGVAAERVRVLPLHGGGTHGEAEAVRDLVKANGLHRIVVVTSPYHTRRALAVFRKVFEGTDAELGVEPATATSEARPGAWWSTPYDRWYVAYEWAAVVYYAFRYRVFSFG